MSLLRLVPPLPPGVPGDEGVIGAGSIAWTVAAEKVVLLGGPAALLLQLAHPQVAAGVAEHSQFQADPLQRLIGTLEAVLVVTFGDRRQAQAMALTVEQRHRPVHGMRDGRPYSALNSGLSLWVYATLVETALDTYSHCFRWLSWAERALYYEQTHPFARLFHVRSSDLPTTYDAFQLYYARMLDQLEVTDTARSIAQALFAARLHHLPVSPLAPLAAAALLPRRRLRTAYGLAWGPRQQLAWRGLSCATTAFLPSVPPRLRQWSHHRTAQRRVGDTFT